MHRALATTLVLMTLGLPVRSGTAQMVVAGGTYYPLGPNGYVYEAHSFWYAPPVYGGYVYGHPAYVVPDLPPIGFGNPAYSGYYDPYYPAYGPGVREFLYFGGADFYGW